MYKVLFVCTGNICRSPTAEGVFRDVVARAGLSDRVATDSSGMGDWHVGQPPDRRSMDEAARRGVDISDLRARQTKRADFQTFDLILAMDGGHERALLALCPPGLEHKVRLFMDFAPDWNRRDVPDPYYGGPDGFREVFDMIADGARGLLDHVRAELPETP